MKLGKYSVTVVKASRLLALRRAALIMTANNKWNGHTPANDEEALLKYDETFLYPSLLACSTGKLPDTFDKFLGLSDEDVDKWLSDAIDKNPHWFPIERSLTQEQTDQKKEIQPTSSTTD